MPKLTAVSGSTFQSADTQALQQDPFANPGMLWVDKGATLWQQQPNQAPACNQCHKIQTNSAYADQPMRGVATRYPKPNADNTGLTTLTQQINSCRTQQQRQPVWAYESDELLALSAYITHQSQGLPFAVSIEGAAAEFFEQGKTYFYTRRGQMNLACNHCHEQNVGKNLRGDKLSQGQSNGYPAYRLEWQNLGSLQRRLQFCNTGVRAEPLPYGAPQYANLELFLAWRAQQLPLESPAVRR